MNYPQIEEGEVVYPRMSGYKMACCDCGLVHRLVFRITRDRKVEMRVYAARRATAAHRRERKKRGEHVP